MASNSPPANMEDSPPSNMEDMKDPLADKPAIQNLGPTLASLSQEQLTMDCQDIVGEILTQVVVCSELGVHGLNGPETTCMSATCSLGGINPTSDISAALAELVSTNQRYRRKSLFNCSKCSIKLSNSTSCKCGQPTDFPKILFRKTFAKAMSFFTKLEALSKNSPTNSPKTHVSIHRWAGYLMSSHSISYTGLLINASGITKRLSCTCFQAEEPNRAMLETDQGDSVALNVSGSIFNSREVG